MGGMEHDILTWVVLAGMCQLNPFTKNLFVMEHLKPRCTHTLVHKWRRQTQAPKKEDDKKRGEMDTETLS